MASRHHVVGFGDNISRWTTPLLDEQPHQEVVAEPSLEELRELAREQGHAEGLAAGRREAHQQTMERIAQLAALLDSLSLPFADLNQQVLDLLVGLSGKIARSLVKRELRTEPEAIMAVVRDTVGILNSSAPKINIYLNPADARLISQLTLRDGEENRWVLIEDPMIAPGDCKVGSLDSIVDGNLTARINTVITQFQGDQRG